MARKKVYSGNISDLQLDDKNFNRHTKRGLEMLGTSLERYGFGRSVLADRDGKLIAGNGVTEKAMAAGGGKTIVVETDGTELVVVKRTDLTLDSKEGRELAAADNIVAFYDFDLDDEILNEMDMKFDMDLEAFGFDDEEEDGSEDEASRDNGEKDGTKLQVQGITVSLPSDVPEEVREIFASAVETAWAWYNQHKID